jgi:hypothetical protein
MKSRETTTDSETLTQRTNGQGVGSMLEEFAGLYQAGYETGFASGHEAGYRRGLETGRLEGRAAVRKNENRNAAAAAPETNAAGIQQSRLFGLPCITCRRLMYSDEARCPYCKAPRVKIGEPPSATCCGPEEVHKRGPDGGLEQ